jgi:putative membrane protein
MDFRRDRNARSHVWYRWFNELPVVFLFAAVVLAVVKPL